ncbi:MAG: hypothetical protein ACKPKO_40735, partial [Candidatus Fonsibacter sp.]
FDDNNADNSDDAVNLWDSAPILGQKCLISGNAILHITQTNQELNGAQTSHCSASVRVNCCFRAHCAESGGPPKLNPPQIHL